MINSEADKCSQRAGKNSLHCCLTEKSAWILTTSLSQLSSADGPALVRDQFCHLRTSRRNTTSDRGLHFHPRQVQLPSTQELKEKQFTQVGECGAPWKGHKNGQGSKQGSDAGSHWMGSQENTNVHSKFALQSEVLSLYCHS